MPVYDDLGNMVNEPSGELAREIGKKVDKLFDTLFNEGMTTVEGWALIGCLESNIKHAATLNIMRHQMRDTVAVKIYGQYPACLDTECKHKKECANHTSAGDYRSEDGDTPNLVKTANGWLCSREPADKGLGAILTDGSYINRRGNNE